MGTDKSLKIIHVVRQFWPSTGGLEDFVDRITSQQVSAGHTVTILTCNSVFADASGAVLEETQIHGDRRIVRVPWKVSTKYPVAPSVLKHLGEADIVHVHAIDFFFDFLAISKILHRKPMVVTTHGGFFHTQDLAIVKKIWFQTLTRFSSLFYARIIGCSDNDKRNFQVIAPRKTISIDNGVNIDKFQNAASKKAQKRILTLGRFSKNKRVDNLINCFSELDEEWQLDIVGAPSDWSGEDIQNMIDAKNLNQRARVHVMPSDEQILDIMKNCSIFASASQFEGFGLAVVEAMSAGLLPVLHNNPTFEDLGQKHPPIEITDFGDPSLSTKAFNAAFDKLKSDDCRSDMIERANEYSWDAVAANYQAVYEEVLA